jgi:hypothetical protein
LQRVQLELSLELYVPPEDGFGEGEPYEELYDPCPYVYELYDPWLYELYEPCPYVYDE